VKRIGIWIGRAVWVAGMAAMVVGVIALTVALAVFLWNLTIGGDQTCSDNVDRAVERGFDPPPDACN
jgi:hypothetical protein